MGILLKAIILASILPVLVASAYFFVPEFSAVLNSLIDDWGGEKNQNRPLVRYKDGAGRQYYVSSIESVPVEFREKAEVDPELPRLNRGEFQPVATPTPTPIVQKRGGDGVIRDRNKGRVRKAREVSFADKKDDTGLPELSESVPYKAVFDAISESLGGPQDE
jgi:hypothetical protein